MEPLRDDDPRVAGSYRLTARLGAGGMGRVYLGWPAAGDPGVGEPASGKPIAVKVLRPDWLEDLDFRKRFRREVEAARRVDGPWVARLLDADPDAASPWLATEYVAGPTISAAVRETGPLPSAVLRRLAGCIAEAMRDIHAVGLVHRDIKPNNILLSLDGPRLIDFGIARATDDSLLTTTGTAPLGAAGYIAPERMNGEAAGPAGDVFSFGAVLVYGATGRNPFGSDQPVTVAYRVVHGEPDLEGVPDEFTDLVRSCLAKDPEARPSAEDLVGLLVPAGSRPIPDDAPWLPSVVRDLITADYCALPAPESEPAPEPAPERMHVLEDSAATHLATRTSAGRSISPPHGLFPAMEARQREVRRTLVIAASVVLFLTTAIASVIAATSHGSADRVSAGSSAAAGPDGPLSAAGAAAPESTVPSGSLSPSYPSTSAATPGASSLAGPARSAAGRTTSAGRAGAAAVSPQVPGGSQAVAPPGGGSGNATSASTSASGATPTASPTSSAPSLIPVPATALACTDASVGAGDVIITGAAPPPPTTGASTTPPGTPPSGSPPAVAYAGMSANPEFTPLGGRSYYFGQGLVGAGGSGIGGHVEIWWQLSGAAAWHVCGVTMTTAGVWNTPLVSTSMSGHAVVNMVCLVTAADPAKAACTSKLT